jgi:hypothetical protein
VCAGFLSPLAATDFIDPQQRSLALPPSAEAGPEDDLVRRGGIAMPISAVPARSSAA